MSKPSGVAYEERTGWAWWAHLAISITLVAAVIPLLELARGEVWGRGDAMPVPVAVLSLALGLGLPAAIYLLTGQLRVRVREDGVEAAWGYSEIIRKRIPFEEIQEAKTVTYAPLRDFGGWGIRGGGGGKTAWTVKGNRAVCLVLRSGKTFCIGSPTPERLLGWIRSVGKGRLGGTPSEP